MSGMPCQICGQYHDTTACPRITYEPEPATAVQYGQCTINGLTFGEQQIVEKLDKIIKLLESC